MPTRPGARRMRSRRKMTTSKRTFRQRRYARSMIVPKINVKRTTFGGTWQFNSAATNDFWRYLDYDMTAFNNFAEFASVFDEYKVNAMKLTFRPAYDSVINPTTAGVIAQPQAYAHYVVDPGATTIPSGTYTTANVNTFLEQGGVRTRTLNKPFSIYFKPKVLGQVLGSGTAATIEPVRWMRTSDTGPRYRGVHMFLQQNAMSTGNANVRLDVFITWYVTFRNVR